MLKEITKLKLFHHTMLQWSPTPNKAYLPRSDAFLLRPLTQELLAEMRKELVSPLPNYRFLRDIECYMYDRDVEFKKELRELVLYAEISLAE